MIYKIFFCILQIILYYKYFKTKIKLNIFILLIIIYEYNFLIISIKKNIFFNYYFSIYILVFKLNKKQLNLKSKELL